MSANIHHEGTKGTKGILWGENHHEGTKDTKGILWGENHHEGTKDTKAATIQSDPLRALRAFVVNTGAAMHHGKDKLTTKSRSTRRHQRTIRIPFVPFVPSW
jgi:hypothetical protein